MMLHLEGKTMELILSKDDLTNLSASARTEILDYLGSRISVKEPPAGSEYEDFYMSDVVDLIYSQVREWMEAASDKTKRGLRVFAEQGPIIHAKALTEAGITNLPHFQSRTTVRTRTVTGNKNAYLLGWDDWDEAEEGEGRYAVAYGTYLSLRRYFHLKIDLGLEEESASSM